MWRLRVDRSITGRRSPVFLGTRHNRLKKPRDFTFTRSMAHQQGMDGLLKVLSAVPGPETDALMGELRSLLECNAHPILDDAGGPAVAQQTPPVRGKVCKASSHLGPVNVAWLRKKKKTCQTSCFLGRVVDGPFLHRLERAAPE